MKRKISSVINETFVVWFAGLSTAGVLIFALFAINFCAVQMYGTMRPFLFFALLFLSLSRLPNILYSEKLENKIGFIKYICFASIYFILAILSVTISSFPLATRIICATYLLTVVANRICIMIERNKVSSYVINSILAFLTAIFFVTGFVIDDGFVVYAYTIAILFLIIIFSMIEVLAFAFSRIQLKSLIKIMKKTYVFEILYGLLILLVTFSFYFYLMEPGFTSFGDGLWYSFAVVTTIGFGDIYATSVIGRILSAILGIYGIIVVAAITSVIVNFYNEVKSKDEKPKMKEDKKDDPEEPKE